MASSSSPFANSGTLKPATLVFTQPVNNNFTINGSANIRPNTASTGTILQPISSGIVPTTSNIIRLGQPLVTGASTQIIPQTIWTSNSSGAAGKIHYTPTNTLTTTTTPQQSTVVPTGLVAKPVVRQTVPTTTGQRYTETQIKDFVAKCRTFLLTLLKLAEKQAPDKLPMVRSCIQDLLKGTIDPESFTQRLHMLYKSQPHTSLVPFFKLALPYMRQIVLNTFGQPITIELLEKLNITASSNNNNNNNNNAVTARTTVPTSACVVVNPSLLSQSSTNIQQPILYTTVQPQQKINLLQQPVQTPTLISSTTSLLGQQQQQQQQARAQINISGIRPIITAVSPSSNTNLLTNQSQTIQSVTQTIIPQSDSLLQRAYLTPSISNSAQTQIFSVSPQTIKTDIGSTTSVSISTVQPQIQKPTIKTEIESTDSHQNLLTVSTNNANDDRHTRHITHDDRLISSAVLRRHFEHLVRNDQRWEGGPIGIHDEQVFALISHAAEERMKFCLNRLRSLAEKRMMLSVNAAETEKPNETNSMEVDTNSNQDDLFEELRPKRKVESKEKSSGNKKLKMISKKQSKRVHLRDMFLLMDEDKHLRRSMLYLKVVDRLE